MWLLQKSDWCLHLRIYMYPPQSMTGQKLSSGIYEQLINKGWRRCGTYYYKNTMDKCCCKSYTIRMNVEQFKIKKQQRKTVKNLLELVKQRKPKPKTKKIEEKREIPKPKE